MGKLSFQILLVVLLQLYYVRVGFCLLEGIYCGKDNCYDVLEVTRNAEKTEIVKAYRRLAKIHHPDMVKTAAEKVKSTDRFQKIANAYEILRDEESRNNYDRMLDHPEEHYRHYYRYYQHRYAKVDVRLVIALVIGLITLFRYMGQRNNYNAAIQYFSSIPKYRLKALEIAQAEEKIEKSDRKKPKKDKAEAKEEQEQIIQKIIAEKMNIKGAYQKPTIWNLFAVQLVLSPYYLMQYVYWWLRWIWKFTIHREEYGDEEKEYLIIKYLGVKREQYEMMEEYQVDELWSRQLWIKENAQLYRSEKEQEQKTKLAESGKYKQYRRWMKNKGPGQMSFGPD